LELIGFEGRVTVDDSSSSKGDRLKAIVLTTEQGVNTSSGRRELRFSPNVKFQTFEGRINGNLGCFVPEAACAARQDERWNQCHTEDEPQASRAGAPGKLSRNRMHHTHRCTSSLIHLRKMLQWWAEMELYLVHLNSLNIYCTDGHSTK